MNSRNSNGKRVLIAVFMLVAALCVTACAKEPEKSAIVPVTEAADEVSQPPVRRETPDEEPTAEPTAEPAAEPTAEPTEAPTSSPTPTPEPTSTPTPTPSPSPSPTEALDLSFLDGDIIGVLTVKDWSDAVEIPPVRYDYVFSNVKEAVNVRSGPGTQYEIVGKFRLKSYAKILEREEGWTKISSGDVVGYVSNAYLYMDEAAITIAKQWNAFTVTISAGEMNVRKEPNTNCEIVGKARKGEKYTWHPELSNSEWYAIEYTDETIAYVSAVYTKSAANLSKALTNAQEEARVRAEWFAKAMAHSKANPPKTTNRAAINLTDEELYLMAVVIAMEALDEPYEGKLMVANVIVNRILCGEWGRTLKDVVYAKGQFTGANSGRVEQFWYKVNEDCKRAAVEAASGYNNIGDYLFFISIGKARFDLYYDYYVYHGHCFYKRHW